MRDLDLKAIAKRVNWYSESDVLLSNVDLFVAQVMARGTTDDVIAVQNAYPLQAFVSAYLNAPPGLFSKRAWSYWGLMLLDQPDRPRPERFAGSNKFDWRSAT